MELKTVPCVRVGIRVKDVCEVSGTAACTQSVLQDTGYQVYFSILLVWPHLTQGHSAQSPGALVPSRETASTPLPSPTHCGTDLQTLQTSLHLVAFRNQLFCFLSSPLPRPLLPALKGLKSARGNSRTKHRSES